VTIRGLSDDQRAVPNIELVFRLLVMQHPDYSDFLIDEDWAWAKKQAAATKTIHYVATKSFKYRLLKALSAVRGRS
ncbi:MAG: hypothetical protein MI723_12615, partial [Caulobacterales bacterium]|nr:hypothetical protein [Caulobacterales bacterium]